MLVHPHQKKYERPILSTSNAPTMPNDDDIIRAFRIASDWHCGGRWIHGKFRVFRKVVSAFLKHWGSPVGLEDLEQDPHSHVWQLKWPVRQEFLTWLSTRCRVREPEENTLKVRTEPRARPWAKPRAEPEPSRAASQGSQVAGRAEPERGRASSESARSRSPLRSNLQSASIEVQFITLRDHSRPLMY